jgi:fructokinase
MADVVCLGEALIDFVATESGVSVGESAGFVRAPGGAPANVAVGVARLGRSSAFLGKVGSDPFGRFLAETFREAGVDTGGMVFSPEYRTGLAFVSLAANGERDFCFFRNPSADMTYHPKELDTARLSSAKIFHYGSITLIDEPARSSTLAAIQKARASGSLISYDPNLRPPLWQSLDTARKIILETLLFADIVKVSEEELGFLFLNHAPDVPLTYDERDSCIAAFHENYGTVELLMVTRGDKGCMWSTARGLCGTLSGFSVTSVDTTGAGDGFVAAVMVQLLERNATSAKSLLELSAEDWKDVFRFANAVGALTTTRKGAIPALPTQAEVSEFLLSQHA